MNNRDKILKGYMYLLSGSEKFVAMTGWKGAQEYYDQLAPLIGDAAAGDSIRVDVAEEGKQTVWRTLSSLTVIKTQPDEN
jgi:hypothetical protein